MGQLFIEHLSWTCNVSAYFLSRLFVILILSCMTLYILIINSLSDISFTHIFYSVGCLFVLLMVSFAGQKFFFILMQSHLFTFLFCCLEALFKNSQELKTNHTSSHLFIKIEWINCDILHKRVLHSNENKWNYKWIIMDDS